MERRFSTIGRIADIAWPDQKLIFEIQCSPIEPEEVTGRCNDYAGLGWTCVWILSDALYNQPRLSQVEWALQEYPHYYWSVENGRVYDQWQLLWRGQRTRGAALPVTVAQPHRLPATAALWALQHRLTWPVGFEGDLVHQLQIGALDIDELRANERPPKIGLLTVVKSGYKKWLRMRLEKWSVTGSNR